MMAAVRRAVAGCDVVFHTAGTVAVWGPALRRMHAVHRDGTRHVVGHVQPRLRHGHLQVADRGAQGDAGRGEPLHGHVHHADVDRRSHVLVGSILVGKMIPCLVLSISQGAVLLIAVNLTNVMSEFAGVASSLELFGISRYISVPLAA